MLLLVEMEFTPLAVVLTFLRVRLALVRQTFSDFQMEGKKPG